LVKKESLSNDVLANIQITIVNPNSTSKNKRASIENTKAGNIRGKDTYTVSINIHTNSQNSEIKSMNTDIKNSINKVKNNNYSNSPKVGISNESKKLLSSKQTTGYYVSRSNHKKQKALPLQSLDILKKMLTNLHDNGNKYSSKGNSVKAFTQSENSITVSKNRKTKEEKPSKFSNISSINSYSTTVKKNNGRASVETSRGNPNSKSSVYKKNALLNIVKTSKNESKPKKSNSILDQFAHSVPKISLNSTQRLSSNKPKISSLQLYQNSGQLKKPCNATNK